MWGCLYVDWLISLCKLGIPLSLEIQETVYSIILVYGKENKCHSTFFKMLKMSPSYMYKCNYDPPKKLCKNWLNMDYSSFAKAMYKMYNVTTSM